MVPGNPGAPVSQPSPGFSSCGSRTQLLRGMWDPPGPGMNQCPLDFFFFFSQVYNSLAGTDQTQVEKVADGLQKKM